MGSYVADMQYENVLIILVRKFEEDSKGKIILTMICGNMNRPKLAHDMFSGGIVWKPQ
jgi:hypothetical protein